MVTVIHTVLDRGSKGWDSAFQRVLDLGFSTDFGFGLFNGFWIRAFLDFGRWFFGFGFGYGWLLLTIQRWGSDAPFSKKSRGWIFVFYGKLKGG